MSYVVEIDFLKDVDGNYAGLKAEELYIRNGVVEVIEPGGNRIFINRRNVLAISMSPIAVDATEDIIQMYNNTRTNIAAFMANY